MNDFFSLRRFSYLVKKTLLERPIQLSGFVGLTLLVTFLIYAVCKLFLPFEEAQAMAFVLGFVGGGSLLASFAFNYFSSAASGSSYLTLPASNFEKWLCGVLITGVLFTMVFLLFYTALDRVLVNLYHNSLNTADPFYQERYNAVHYFPLNGFVASKVYIMFLNSTGVMLVGSLYFNKGGFIKSALIACGLFVGGHILNYWMAKAIFESVDRALPYYSVFIKVGAEEGKVMLPAYADNAVAILLYLFPALLWGIAWLRLREKEF